MLRPAVGGDPGWTPPVPVADGAWTGPDGSVWLCRVSPGDAFWLEVGGEPEGARRAAEAVRPVLAQVLDAERQRTLAAEELAGRYEEIDLLYAISEILGRTVRLEEAAQIIMREVASVIGARRASIMVHDEAAGLLRTVAASGWAAAALQSVRVDDEFSVAARVFRERRVLAYDPERDVVHPGAAGRGIGGRGYNTLAFLSVPIMYGTSGNAPRCVGVINLTDRIGGDRFSPGDRKLLTAIANQIGAALENARLVQRDRQQQRLRRELELAHDLQLKLLPPPSVLGGEAEVAARCRPAESVGGDFYTFSRLGHGRVGVMLGDVASHGFSAALIMALVFSAAAMHVSAASSPGDALTGLLESLGDELENTEMHLTVFYGVLDREAGTLTYASAGHPYGARIARDGTIERLAATAPPLGLVGQGRIPERRLAWRAGDDLLALWTDGITDARGRGGDPYGTERLLDAVARRREEPLPAIVDLAFAEADLFAEAPADDRTLLVMRI